MLSNQNKDKQQEINKNYRHKSSELLIYKIKQKIKEEAINIMQIIDKVNKNRKSKIWKNQQKNKKLFNLQNHYSL